MNGGSMFRSRSTCVCRFTLLAAVVGCLAAAMAPSASWAEGQLHGHSRIEKIKGDPSKGYVELYEYKAFLSPNGNGTGHSYHIGDPGSALHPYQGCIYMPKPDDPVPLNPGTYSLMTSWGEIFPRGKVVSGINIVNAPPTTQQDALEPIDYSGYYDKTNWDSSGGNPVFQTFIATGTSITRASFAKADGSNTGSVEFSIHRDTGGNVETWPRVGPVRSVNRGGSGSDHWVSWNAGEVPTTPGQRYAIRLYGTSGVNVQPYWSNDSFYPQGTGYRTNQSNPAGHDYYIVVFSDNDDTINTMSPRSSNIGNLAGWWDRWAQSYTASGASLAGACLMGTLGGSDGWVFSVRVTIHSGSPAGPQVGPTKVMPVAFRPFIGVAGVCFSRGEVPTTAGQTYWIVYEREGGGGFNALRNSEGNTYAGGTASYYNGTWNTQSYDLYMSIYEYAQTGPTPTPTPTEPPPQPGENLLSNWGFEMSAGVTHPSWTNNADIGTNGAFPNPGGAHEGTQWASYSHGGAIIQELYQTVPVTPGHTYRVSAYCNVGGDGSTATARLLWANGAYPGKGSGTPVDSRTWTFGEPFISWTELSGLVTPTAGTLTFIIQADIGGWSGGVNFDDCAVVDQTAPQATPTNTEPPPPPTNTPVPPPTPTNTVVPPATPTLPTTGIDPAGWRFY